jgi:hypothetical protein
VSLIIQTLGTLKAAGMMVGLQTPGVMAIVLVLTIKQTDRRLGSGERA